MNRRSCASDWRQHEAQGGASILEIVDLQNPRWPTEAFNQFFEFVTIVQTMNFETNRQQAAFDAPEVGRKRCSGYWSFRLQKGEQILDSVRVAHSSLPSLLRFWRFNARYHPQPGGALL